MTSLKGVRLTNKSTYVICYVDDFSEDLKELIRSQLAPICHGASKASKKRKTYNYTNTVKSFLERYEKKAATTKIGMIGELLTHILIIQFLTDYNTVSPFFNMEERSIKKGFDIVMYHKNKNELWITEVKSGELHEGKDSDETNKTLLGKAKVDLKNRLNENESTLWENAINGATIALENIRDKKEAVIAILDDIADEISEQKAVSTDKNVILVTSLFSTLKEEIQEHVISSFYTTTKSEKIFKNLFVFSIQKNTYDKVYQFLREEAEK
ncbi:DUF1837 domain-containing protein [Metasolibacillus fluoroglycofenilyticus]|uniref:DUF1837 domain-containing protein n=1 Tax=Metasolibacillus fluoroglycofenilyticus TaxID=1239396 RepID=UPI000D3B0D7E|nr:DUF1837 domain-containing protein [Metasolibacillus fluoroglycofenilyticus]